ncbi:MAG: STAS domain-containing protein [Spirochaetaceae bacterium]|jgi:anti-anti-sigma factor|nr:STAS domain-containing protein [Spirochaetaceae bacterium]
MTIDERKDGLKTTLVLDGKLDTKTAPALESIFTNLNPITREVILDFSKLTYISSLGLRAILQLFKKMKAHNGKLTIINIPENIRSVFGMSGFIQAFVRDEKLAIIEKENHGNDVVYALNGILDAETSVILEIKCTQLLKEKAALNLILDCNQLSSISEEGCEAITGIQNEFLSRKRTFGLRNIPPFIQKKITKNESSSPKKDENGDESTRLVFIGEWEFIDLPVFNEEWKNAHDAVKTVILDFKKASNITPEAFSKIMMLKKDGMAMGISVDVQV